MGSQRRSQALAALDVGSSKVVGAVALPEEGGLRVLAVAQAPGAGVRRGAVVDPLAASAAMAAVAERLRRMAGIPLPPLLLGSAGGELLSSNREAEISLDPPATLEQAHLDGLLAEVRGTPLPPGYQLVHTITQEYTLDGYEGCPEPLGMAAGRLGLSAHLVACHGTLLANLLRAAADAGIEVEDFAVAGLAAAESVLSEQERHAGVVLLDFGASATQVAVVVDGQTVGSAVVPLGGEHISADIAKGLRIARDEAEEVKRREATADARPAPAPEQTPAEGAEVAPPTVDAPDREQMLAEIVSARCEEILERVGTLLQEGGLADLLGAGAVLTGGGSRLRGLSALAMRTLGLRVRSGGPQGTEGLLGTPECAACVGLLQMAALRRSGGRRAPAIMAAVRRPWPLRLLGRA